MRGRIVSLDALDESGFIQDDQENQYFFRDDAVADVPIGTLRQGMAVSFEPILPAPVRGSRVVNIRLINDQEEVKNMGSATSGKPAPRPPQPRPQPVGPRSKPGPGK